MSSSIHDELDLKPGAIRVKTGGGNAGHNGLKSMSAHIGNEYARVRLGIGHPGDKALVSNYVLHDFAKDDKAWLDPLLEGVARGIAQLIEGSEAAFLSEAARGRGQSAPAAQKNVAPRQAEAVAVEMAPAAQPMNASAIEEAVPSATAPMTEAMSAPVIQEAVVSEIAPEPEVAAAPAAKEAVVSDAAPMAEAMSAPAMQEAVVCEIAPEPEVAAAPVAKEAVSEIDGLQAVLAAASKPIQPMSFNPTPAAAREGGSSTFSRAVIVETPPAQSEPIVVKQPDPQPEMDAEPSLPEPIAVAQPEPQPITVSTPVAVIQAPDVSPAETAVPQPEPGPAPIIATETQPPAEIKIASAPQPEPTPTIEVAQTPPVPVEDNVVAIQAAVEEKKRGGIFSSWFRTRVRGASSN